MEVLKIHSFETLGGLDGPGIRFIVFFQGCNLRCKYCHNPDTWNISGGQSFDIYDIYIKAVRYNTYFGEKGGVTLSGGEPLMQAKELKKLISLFNENNIRVTIDTSGAVFNQDTIDCLKLSDLVILDVKHTDRLEYEKLTDGNFDNFVRTWSFLRDIKKETWLRQVIAPTITDEERQVQKLLEYKSENVTKIELLPYHRLGIPKWEGLNYELYDIEPPTPEVMARLNKIVK